jgi:hypothetical protein
MGLSVRNATIPHNLFADEQVIIAKDKDNAEYIKKINRRMSDVGLKCKYS